MSKQIEEVMNLVIEVACKGIDYGASEGKTKRLENLKKLHEAEEVVASKLREILPGWQPIESAPKDGTEVLCWREDCGRFIAKYTSADSFPMTQAEIDAYDEETLFSKDWFTQWPQAIRLDGSETPTHWMPLPKAPA